MFLVIILMAITYFIYNKENKYVSYSNNVKKIFDIDKDNITQICMENSDGKFMFQKSNNQWEVISPLNLKFDKMRIDGILYTMSNLNIERIVEENASDLEQYGLINPSLVTIKLIDGKSNTLEIGNVTPLKDGYYVKVKNEPTIYKVNTGVGQELLQGRKDFRDRRLFGMEEQEFMAFQMKKENEIIFDVKKEQDIWKVISPIEGNTNFKGIEPIFNTFSYLCVDKYVEDDSRYLDKYGLDKPTRIISIISTKFNKKLYLGKEIEEDQSVYAKIDGNNDIFTLKLKDISVLDNIFREIYIDSAR
jgi:hypothetical protein